MSHTNSGLLRLRTRTPKRDLAGTIAQKAALQEEAKTIGIEVKKYQMTLAEVESDLNANIAKRYWVTGRDAVENMLTKSDTYSGMDTMFAIELHQDETMRLKNEMRVIGNNIDAKRAQIQSFTPQIKELDLQEGQIRQQIHRQKSIESGRNSAKSIDFTKSNLTSFREDCAMTQNRLQLLQVTSLPITHAWGPSITPITSVDIRKRLDEL